MKRFDVAVIGAGPAGIGAALSAARQGVSVVLVERHDVLGGMGTAGLVNIFCNAFYDGERFIIGGIFGEIRQRLIDQGRLFSPVDINDGEPFDPVAYNEILLEMCADAGIQVMFNQSVVDWRFVSSDVAEIRLQDGLLLRAGCVVDATGDAMIAHLAGVPFTQGRAEDAAVMPLTTCFITGPVDLAAAQQITPDALNVDRNSDKPFYFLLHQPWMTEMVHEAIASGRWDIPRDNGAVFSIPGKEHLVSVNFTRIFIEDPTDPVLLEKASEEGRRQVEQCIQFFRDYFPGFKGARLVEMARQIGVRESRQIVGLYRLTEVDVLENRQFEDVIAQCCYGIDEHKPDSDTWSMDYFAKGQHYDIPLRSLIPLNGPPNLIVAGRCISAEREAMASFRVQPSVMAIGEAAGVTAALGVLGQVAIKDVAYADVRARLLANGAILD